MLHLIHAFGNEVSFEALTFEKFGSNALNMSMHDNTNNHLHSFDMIEYTIHELIHVKTKAQVPFRLAWALDSS